MGRSRGAGSACRQVAAPGRQLIAALPSGTTAAAATPATAAAPPPETAAGPPAAGSAWPGRNPEVCSLAATAACAVPGCAVTELNDVRAAGFQAAVPRRKQTGDRVRTSAPAPPSRARRCAPRSAPGCRSPEPRQRKYAGNSRQGMRQTGPPSAGSSPTAARWGRPKRRRVGGVRNQVGGGVGRGVGHGGGSCAVADPRRLPRLALGRAPEDVDLCVVGHGTAGVGGGLPARSQLCPERR